PKALAAPILMRGSDVSDGSSQSLSGSVWARAVGATSRRRSQTGVSLGDHLRPFGEKRTGARLPPGTGCSGPLRRPSLYAIFISRVDVLPARYRFIQSRSRIRARCSRDFTVAT